MSIATALFFVIYRGKKAEMQATIEQLKGTRELSVLSVASKQNKEWKLILYILIFSITWGVALFSIRYFSVNHLPVSKFVWCWYLGATLGSLTIFLTTLKKQEYKIPKRDLIEVFGLSCTMIGSLAPNYWSMSFADKPQIALQPIYLVSGIILPTLLGLYYFKEIKNFDGYDRFLLCLAALAGTTIALNLR